MKKLRKLISKFTPERILRKSSLLIMENFQGVDFSRIVWPEEVGLDSKSVGESCPSWNKYIVRVLKDLQIITQDTILDIGCGKGSAMLAMLNSLLAGSFRFTPILASASGEGNALDGRIITHPPDQCLHSA